MARRVARDIPDGAYVNLGIGLPTLVADHIPAQKEIILHCENGILGAGPTVAEADQDPDLINAGKQHIGLKPGGSYFHHADSFAMIRGGHLDFCVLGGFQVSARGDLANWSTGTHPDVPAVGGAMDLAVGAKSVFVMMTHFDKRGASKIVEACTYPLTGTMCVDRIYTDLAILDVSEDGLRVVEVVKGLSVDELQDLTAAPIKK